MLDPSIYRKEPRVSDTENTEPEADDAENEEAEGTDLFPEEAEDGDKVELPEGALSVDLPGEQPSSVPLHPESVDRS